MDVRREGAVAPVLTPPSRSVSSRPSGTGWGAAAVGTCLRVGDLAEGWPRVCREAPAPHTPDAAMREPKVNTLQKCGVGWEGVGGGVSGEEILG